MDKLAKYKMTLDYHTHTVHSHGKGTIRENVLAAREQGLKEIAITDHGPGHLEHGMRRDDVANMRAIVDQLNQEFDDIKVHLGVEANIIRPGNCLDVTPEEFGQYDFVIAGYHYGMADAYCGENWWTFQKGICKPEQKARNTEMVLRALYENDLRILTHPGEKAYFDLLEIAYACAETDTWMEINTDHRNLTAAQIKLCAQTDAKFVISSDAHTPEKVGNYLNGLRRAFEAGLDPERIVNIVGSDPCTRRRT